MDKYNYNPHLYANTYEFLNDIVEKYSERSAIRWMEQGIYKAKSYCDMMEDINSFVMQMEERKLVQRHIALVGKPSYAWIIGFLAILYSGSVAVPLNGLLPVENIKKDMAFADASAVIIGDIDIQIREEICLGSDIPCIDLDEMMAKKAERKKEEYAKVDTDALACIMFTTGTTGARKGVMLSQQNLMAGATQAAAVSDVRKYNSALATLPNYHILELSGTYLSGLYFGCELFLGKEIKYFSRNLKNEKPEIMEVVPLFLQVMEKKIRRAIKKKGERKFYLATLICRGLLKLGINAYTKVFWGIYEELGSNIKTFIVGGAFLSSETVSFFAKFGISVLQGYGMTETTGAVTCNRDYDINAKSVGRAMPFSEVRIKEGEVQVKGKNVMLGYYKEPELTKEAFDEGWLCTGDLGYIDEKGFLYLTGRKKNLIILSDGENVSPEMWEETIKSKCEDINDIIVFEQENKIMAKIYSESGEEGEIRKIIESFNTSIPYAQRIQKVIFNREPLPRTATGKLKRD